MVADKMLFGDVIRNSEKGRSMTRCLPICGLAGAMLVFGLSSADDKNPDPLPGIGPNGPVQKMDGKYTFTEGPAVDADGNVYFSDIPAEKIHKVDTVGKVTVFREKSNHANGLMVNAKGEWWRARWTGRLSRSPPTARAAA